MKRLLACLLLAASGGAWSADNAYTASDNRIPIEVTARERNQILFEMREFLHGWHNIHHALARDDMKAVSLEVQPLGQAMNRIPADVQERLPEGFMQMWLAMHEAFRQLGKVADARGDARGLQEQIAEITTYCSGCHDTYRFEVVRTLKAQKR